MGVAAKKVNQNLPNSGYPLTDDQRVQEIARMLGGLTITQKTLDHAREMLRR